MDILLPGREYAVFIPQIGPAEQASAGAAPLIAALEAGGATMKSVMLVPGITRVQLVDVTKGPDPRGPLPPSDADQSAHGRATEQRAFGA